MRTPFRVAGALTLCALPPLGGQEAPLNEAEAVLLQAYLGRTPLGDGLEAYPVAEGTAEGALVPLGELCRLLAFGIQVDAANGTAEGFFIHEKRTFRLDLAKGTVDVGGKHLTIPAGQVRRQGHDLFVEARLLAQWFPFTLEVDFKGAALVLTAQEKLPIEDIWERENRYGNEGLRRYGDDPTGASGRWQPTPYSFLSVPFADLSLAATKNSNAKETSTQGAVNLAGDLLWMSSNLYISRDQAGKWRDGRVSLFREDPQGGLLGPLHARRLVLGDLMGTPSMDLVGSLPQGRGLSLDNYPVAYRTRFATRSFRGTLLEGWSVELFQNDGLLGYQRARPDGLYEFKEVPLRFGVNQFKLVFHGPQGQQREETFRLDIAQDQPPPGAFHYSLAYVQPRAQDLQNSALGATGLNNGLGTGTTPLDPTGLGTTDPTLQPTLAAKPAFQVQAEYGLSPSFALQGGASHMQVADTAHTYGMLGLRGVWPFLAVQLNAAQDSRQTTGPSNSQATNQATAQDTSQAGQKPGQAAEVVLRTGLGYTSLTLRHGEYRQGFQRSLFGGNGLGNANEQVQSTNAVDLAGTLKLGPLPLSLSAGLEAETYLGGAKGLRQRATLSTQFAGLNVANTLSRMVNPDAVLKAPLDGNLMVSSYWQSVSLQGGLTYQSLDGRKSVKGWNAQSEYHTVEGLSFRLGLQGTPGASNGLSAVAGVNKMLGRFSLGLDLQGTAKAYSASLRFQLSLGREPRSGRWTTNAQSLVGQGAVSAVAFLDTNGNGLRDPGEPLLEGVAFKVTGTNQPNRIQDPKVTLITQLAKGQETDISLDESSLEDAAQKSMVKAFRIVPRPGKVARLDFPVSTFGEVTGTTRVRRGNRTEVLPGLELEILQVSGEQLKQVKQLRSAYDGFFEIRDLPYGDYLLRVTPTEVARIKLREVPEARRFRIDQKRNFLDGQDLVVRMEAPAQAEAQPSTMAANAPAPTPAQPPVAKVEAPQVPAAIPAAIPAPVPAPSLAADPAVTPGAPSVPALPLPVSPVASKPAVSPQGNWTVVLVLAYKDETIARAQAELGPRGSDLFVLPEPGARGKKPLRRVCVGRYASTAEAQRALAALPGYFFADGNRPRVLELPPNAAFGPAAPTAVPTAAPVVAPRAESVAAPPGTWTVLLTLAFKDEAITKATSEAGSRGKEVFVRLVPGDRGKAPLRQVCLGQYPGAVAAHRALATLSPYFFQEGNRPRILELTPAASEVPAVPTLADTKAPTTAPAAPAPAMIKPAPAPVAKPGPPAPATPAAAQSPAPTHAPLKAAAAVEAQGSWSILLVLAYEDETIAKAVEALGAQGPNLFVLAAPGARGAKPLRKVCFGHYPSAAEARQALAALPSHFTSGGNHPRVFQVQPHSPKGARP